MSPNCVSPGRTRPRRSRAPRYADHVPAGRDDDALTWDGDDDPTLDVGANPTAPGDSKIASTDAAPGDRAGTGALPEGFTAVGKGSEDVPGRRVDDGHDEAVEESRAPMSNGALIGLGIFGGVYLLLTLGGCSARPAAVRRAAVPRPDRIPDHPVARRRRTAALVPDRSVAHPADRDLGAVRARSALAPSC